MLQKRGLRQPQKRSINYLDVFYYACDVSTFHSA